MSHQGSDEQVKVQVNMQIRVLGWAQGKMKVGCREQIMLLVKIKVTVQVTVHTKLKVHKYFTSASLALAVVLFFTAGFLASLTSSSSSTLSPLQLFSRLLELLLVFLTGEGQLPASPWFSFSVISLASPSFSTRFLTAGTFALVGSSTSGALSSVTSAFLTDSLSEAVLLPLLLGAVSTGSKRSLADLAFIFVPLLALAKNLVSWGWLIVGRFYLK